ncbi:thiamine transporter 1-like [Prorops nasuta]|uniref:thiamine transporter 1-like n=1 Tax=Prorops nasuta TaxID=863751 RepID=UPI0034CE6A31
MKWWQISLLLCCFGFLKDFRPGESFVTNYLTGPWKNFTETEVNQYIYPISTYSYLTCTVFVFLLTDLVRYKPVIILCGLSGTACFLTLVLGKTLFLMQIVEFLYGLFLSAEIAYYTYIYAKVDKKHYQEVAGHTKGAALVGRFMSAVVAQIATSFYLLDYHELTMLTAGALAISVIFSLFLPSVEQSIYFHSSKNNAKSSPTTEPINASVNPINSNLNQSNLNFNLEKRILQLDIEKHDNFKQKIRNACKLLWTDFWSAYTNVHVIKWSAWWAFATCGYLQVATYMQLIWIDIAKDRAEIYNGAVDAMYTIIGAITVFIVSKVPLNWPLLAEAILSVFSILEGVLVIISAITSTLWVSYICYVGFGIIYHTIITIANFEVAKYINEDSFGLIFGINTFLTLGLQSVLTIIVVDGPLNLDIRKQFIIYGGYYLILGILFMIMGILTIVMFYRKGERFRFFATVENNKRKP